MRNESSGFIGAAFVVTLMVAAGYGWICNIIQLAKAEAFSGFVLLRAVGIFFAPLGAILGYV